jgi:hypothetical protein
MSYTVIDVRDFDRNAYQMKCKQRETEESKNCEKDSEEVSKCVQNFCRTIYEKKNADLLQLEPLRKLHYKDGAICTLISFDYKNRRMQEVALNRSYTREKLIFCACKFDQGSIFNLTPEDCINLICKQLYNSTLPGCTLQVELIGNNIGDALCKIGKSILSGIGINETVEKSVEEINEKLKQIGVYKQ